MIQEEQLSALGYQWCPVVFSGPVCFAADLSFVPAVLLVFPGRYFYQCEWPKSSVVLLMVRGGTQF